jgi:hypothetical protein
MTLKLNIMSNGSALDLHLSQKIRIFNIVIHEYFVIVLDRNAIGHLIVMKHLKEIKWAPDKEENIESAVPMSLII